MSGEELAFLMNNLGVWDKDCHPKSATPSAERKLVYGIKGIKGIKGVAETFGCSIPTANRIKKSGIIDKAVSQEFSVLIIYARKFWNEVGG